MISRIKIPEARLGVLIGSGGVVKKRIEQELGVRISIGEYVAIESEDALAVMSAENIVRAIGRGFAPEKAFKLLSEENVLEILELPKSERELKRVCSRLIGAKGKARANLERLTGCDISVYGKTVSIIGPPEAVDKARQAIEMLIEGSSHRAVWTWLERRR
ncbi:MAG: KH domain-containing protein [Candidatus Aenigmatarchaeota archaeon]